jgi:hypothetical protein
VVRERRRRFVEDQQACASLECSGDLNHLLLADAEMAERLGGIERAADPREGFPGARVEFGAFHEAVLRRLAPNHDVLGDGAVRKEAQLLVHRADAAIDRVERPFEARHLPIDEQSPAIGLVHTAQNVHQRGLARAVLAHDRVDRSWSDLEGHILKDGVPSEPLADAVESDEGGHARSPA